MSTKIRNAAVCLVLLVLGAEGVWAQEAREMFNGREAVSNQILIRLRNNNAAGFQNLASGFVASDSIEVLHQGLGLVLVKSPTRRIAALLAAFANRGDLLYAEPNYTLHTAAVPNDQYYGQLYGMPKISAPSAWDIATGSQAPVIAIVDSGVNYSHPDLAANIWSAPAAFTVTVGGVQVSCPIGSHGLNAITMTCDPADDNGHGSHVAGILGAVGNNTLGVTGVNWNASIMALKFLDSTGTGSTANAIRALNFAIQVKQYFAGTSTPVNIRVLSNSWSGTGFTQSLLDAINSTGTNEMLFVSAAGNSDANTDNAATKEYPVSYAAATQISVAATDSNDARASFSNYGPTTVHLGAPGVNILSTYLNSDYATLSGTSMATPHVSGAAALILAACPQLTTAQLKTSLIANVDPIPSMTGITVSGGRLNVYKSIQACSPSAPAPTLNAITVSPSAITSGQVGTVTISLIGSAKAGGSIVSLSSSSSTVVLPASVNIAQGSSIASVTFTAGSVSVATPFTITATLASGVKTFAGTVSPIVVNGSGGVISLLHPGTGALRVNGAMGNASFTSVPQFRVETRLHSIGSAAGYVWQVGTFALYFGASDGTNHYLYFSNSATASVACQLNIGTRTDITLRAQKDGSGVISLGVWDASGVLVTGGFCWDSLNNSAAQQGRPGPDNLGGSAGLPLTIGSTVWGVTSYQGAMAYFRLFSSATSATTSPSETSGTGTLLSYEFENNLLDSSSSNQTLTKDPPTANYTYVSSGGTIADTTPPTVAITSPTGTQPLNGGVSVQASDSDNVGVVGLQFKLDGAALGAEILNPASTATYAWDTTGTSNGTHTLTAVARDAAGNVATSGGVLVTVSNGQLQSLLHPGTGALRVNGAMGNASFTSVPQFRLETRLHSIGLGTAYVWQVGTFALYFGASDGTNHYLYFSNSATASVACELNIGTRTDITLRAQKDSSGVISLNVWDPSGAPVTGGFCWDSLTNSTTQQGRVGPDNLGGSSGMPHTIGSSFWGVYSYQGAMAYFRLFSAATNLTTSPSETSGTGTLLSYEFEDNLSDSSPSNQTLTKDPPTANYTYVNSN